MTLRTKKILAREFLFLIGIALFSVIGFTGIYLYNKSIDKRISKIEKKRDDLYEKEQQRVRQLKENANQQLAIRVKSKYPEYSEVDNILLANKIVAKYPEYQSFLDSISNEKSDTVMTRLSVEKNAISLQIQKREQKKISYGKELNLSFTIFGVIFLITFCLRYLLYGLKWSIQTLRQGNSST